MGPIFGHHGVWFPCFEESLQFTEVLFAHYTVLFLTLSYFAHECFAPLLGRYETPWVQKLVADRLMIAHTEDRAASYFRKMVGRASSTCPGSFFS